MSGSILHAYTCKFYHRSMMQNASVSMSHEDLPTVMCWLQNVLHSCAQHAGRALLRTLHAPLRHDLYCAVLGAYAIWASVAAAARLHGLVQRTRGGRAMMTELQGWLVTAARLGLLAFLTLIVVPFMAGLYLDLVMLPFRQVCCLACCEGLCVGRWLMGQGLCRFGRVFVCSPVSLVTACASVCFSLSTMVCPDCRQLSEVWHGLLSCMQ